MKILTGEKEFFPGIGEIKFEGRESDNPLAFKWYDENKIVAGKKLKDHLKFAVAYWHSFCNTGGDPFRPGNQTVSLESVFRSPCRRRRIKWMLHSNSSPNSVFPTIVFMILIWWMKATTSAEYEKRSARMVEYAKQKQAASGVKLLMGNSQCIFKSPVYERSSHQSGFFNHSLMPAFRLKMPSMPRLRWRRKLCFLGWEGRVYVAAEYQYETGSGTPGPVSWHGPRLCAQTGI